MDEMIRISLHDNSAGNNVVTVEINSQSTVQNLISSYCAKKGIGYNPKLVIYDGQKNTLSQFRTLQSLGITNGQSLYVGYEKKSTVMDRKWIFVLSIIVVAVFIVAIITLSSIYATSGGVIPFDFGVVIDGGSSKTNVLLYKWAGDKYHGTGCVRQEHACSIKIPIAKATNVTYFLGCVDDVKGNIKKSSISSTPLYFASTAGMRTLNMSDPIKTQMILDNLTIVLNETGMSLKTVSIISGEDEGRYAWITANFLKDTLETEQKLNPWHPTTVGALDMGGASNQISFALEPKNTTDPGVVKTQLYGQTHDVFSASFLCFGRDEAERRHRAMLVKDPKDIKDIIDPCSPIGFKYNVTGEDLLDNSCTQSDLFKKWLNDNKDLKDKNISFVGSSDYAACSKAMTLVSDYATCKERNFRECFQKINQPLKDQKFLAFATYYYTTSALQLDRSNLTSYMTGTSDFCSKNYDQVRDMFKHDKYLLDYASSYCFNACYMYEILINGFGFGDDTWSNIEFLGKIGDKDIGWALGLMIDATNVIPAKGPSPKFMTMGGFIACIIVFISITIAAAVFLGYNFGRRKSGQHYFQNA